MNRFTDWLSRALPYLLLAPLLLPLVVGWDVIYPFVTPKTFILRGLGVLVLAAFIYLIACGRAFHFSRLSRWVTWIPAVLLVVAYITSIFGLDFSVSFWSTFVRGDGVATLTALTISFYGILLVADKTWWGRVAKTVAIVGTVVAAFGFLQWLIYILNIPISLLPSGGDRVGSTLGNAAFLAAYLAVSGLITLALRKGFSKSWKTWAPWLAAFQILVAVLTATRGTILALVLAGVVTLVWYGWKQPSTRRWSVSALVAIVVIAGFFVALRGPLSHSGIEPVRRLASISFSDPDTASRLFIWQNVTAETFSSGHWVLGYGAEHITTPFDKVYDPTKIDEEWFDRTHNSFLDYFVQYGILGFLLYIALIVAIIWECVRWGREDESRIGYILALGVLVYAAQDFFVFDTSSLLYVLYALFAVVLVNRAQTKESPDKLFTQSVPWAGIVVGIVLICTLWWVVWQPLRANILLREGYAYGITNVALEAQDLSEGYALHTYANLEYGYEVDDLWTNYQENLDPADKVTAYNTAYAILSANFARYPYDARTALYFAQLLDTAPTGVTVDNGIEKEVSEHVLSLSPRREQPWYILTNLDLAPANGLPMGAEKTALYQSAITLLKQYEALVPTLSEPHYILADLYVAVGDTADASAEAALGKAAYAPDLATATRAAGYYESVQDWPDTVYFLTQITTLNPTDYASLYDLAKADYLDGNPAAADQIVVKLRTLDPAIIATDPNFEAAITAYEHSNQ